MNWMHVVVEIMTKKLYVKIKSKQRKSSIEQKKDEQGRWIRKRKREGRGKKRRGADDGDNDIEDQEC